MLPLIELSFYDIKINVDKFLYTKRVCITAANIELNREKQ